MKGATNVDDHWWVGYGNCTKAIIEKLNNETMFNRRSSFYKATHVVLVAVRSPKEYSCIVLPADEAEKAAQLNLAREFRKLNGNGQPMAPGKVYIELEPRPRATPRTIEGRKNERAILAAYRDEKGWEHLRNSVSAERNKIMPEVALKNIKTLIEGAGEMEDLRAYRILVESIRVLGDKASSAGRKAVELAEPTNENESSCGASLEYKTLLQKPNDGEQIS